MRELAFVLLIAVCLGLACSGDKGSSVDTPSPPEAEWESAFGGSMNEGGYSVRQTSDGGYIVAGDTYSYGSGDRDVYLVKVGSEGEMEWDEAYGGAEADGARSTLEASGGGYVIAGFTRSSGAGESDIYVVKVSSSGAVEWDSTYGGASNDNAMHIIQTLDGGYMVTGNTHSSETSNDVFLLKLTSAGAVDWFETYGGDANDFGRAVGQTADGGYIVTGGTHSFGPGDRDIYLCKVNSTGVVEWEDTYGGEADDYGISVQQTADGGYIVGGQTASTGSGGVDAYLLKVDSGGGVEWDAAFGGTLDDYGLSVAEVAGEGYLLAGETYSLGLGETDAYLIRADTGGNLEWSTTFGTTSWDGAASMDLTTDGGCVLAGYTSPPGGDESDVYLIKVEAE